MDLLSAFYKFVLNMLAGVFSMFATVLIIILVGALLGFYVNFE